MPASSSQASRRPCICIIGTRPEVIKMAPVIRRLRDSDWAEPIVVAVGQHIELLDQAIADFGLHISHRLEVRRRRQSIMEVASIILDRLDLLLDRLDAACVIAQGDTTTVMAASLVAFHRGLPFVHVEAGLRTGDLAAPFPEEFNRRVVSLATALHCAPTRQAADNLLAEGVRAADCIVTGNTVIDALLDMAARKPPLPPGFPAVPRPILVTAHRRENAGPPLRRMLAALREAVERYPDIGLFFPVHPNPDTRRTASEVLAGHDRICLSAPVGYAHLVAALAASWIVVTDSGGLQEEAPALGKPVLVLREVTERPEAVDCGAAALMGTDPARLLAMIAELHGDTRAFARMAQVRFPYGDGRAAERIVDGLRGRLAPDAARSCATQAM